MSKFKKFLREIMGILNTKEMSILPGNLAYYFLLSLIPIVTIVMCISVNFNISLTAIKTFIETTFSSNVASFLKPMLNDFTFNLKTIFILIVAFLLASNGAKSIVVASNTVFGIKDSGIVKRQVKSIVILIMLVILFTFILVVPLFGNTLLKFFKLVKLDNEILSIFNILYPVLKYPLSILIIFIFIKLIYTMAPDERIPSAYVNKGAIFTTIFWVLSTAAFSFYINNIVHYEKIYNSFAGIIILLIYFYLLAYIFVIGLVLNYRNIEEKNNIENTIKLEEISNKIKESTNK